MPNIITHGLFAKSVLNEMSNDALKQCITKYPREYIIGSNGPDFFFFYKFFQKKQEPIREIGSKVHASHVNDFFEIALHLIHDEKDQDLASAMTSYLCGHLCHWALDSHAHPYIFYKTGNYSGINASMHHRFESMLDAMMLMEIKKETIQTFKFYLLAKQSSISVKAISAIYLPILRDVFHIDLTEKHIQDALNDWYRIQTYLYDPKKIKTKILKSYEKKVNKPYLFSGNVVPLEIDETFDVMNNQHAYWCYPTDNTKESHDSFMDIYKHAQEKAVMILNHLDNMEYVLENIGNASYDTQESERKEMKYFDLIYGDML